MELMINDDNLSISDIDEFNTKVRAILIDENNEILVANYGSVILLPGGKVDGGETDLMAIIRELKEEIGQEYSDNELKYFGTLNFYQSRYPKRNGTYQNRLITTHYFIGKYKKIEQGLQKLTEKEKESNFSLELVSLEALEEMINNNRNSNPRNIYFQRELLTILASYKNAQNKPNMNR